MSATSPGQLAPRAAAIVHGRRAASVAEPPRDRRHGRRTDGLRRGGDAGAARAGGRDPLIAGVVGWVDLTAPDVNDALARLRASPGGELLVGIRHQVQEEPDPWYLARADVRRGLRAVAEAGLVYDLLVRPHQLPAAVDAVRAAAGAAVRARPRRQARGLGPADRAVAGRDARALASFQTSPSSSRGSPVRRRPAGRRDAAAVRRTLLLDSFGPGRLMFGSDWPVCLLGGGYDATIAATEALTAQLSRAGAPACCSAAWPPASTVWRAMKRALRRPDRRHGHRAGLRRRAGRQPLLGARRRRPRVSRSTPPGTGASATSTPPRTTASGCRSAGSVRRCAAARAISSRSRPRSVGCLSPTPRRPVRTSQTAASTCPTTTAASWITAATAFCAASRPASSGSGSIASTSSLCTTPKITWRPPWARPCPRCIELREQGVVGAVGVGMNFVEPLRRFVAEADIDVVLVAGRWTLVDQSAAPLLDDCLDRDVARDRRRGLQLGPARSARTRPRTASSTTGRCRRMCCEPRAPAPVSARRTARRCPPRHSGSRSGIRPSARCWSECGRRRTVPRTSLPSLQIWMSSCGLSSQMRSAERYEGRLCS